MDRLKNLSGQMYGEYELLEQIGTGTYGIVYKAEKRQSEGRGTASRKVSVLRGYIYQTRDIKGSAARKVSIKKG